MTKVITSFQIDEARLAEIDERAASEGKSRSRWIREAVAKAMERSDSNEALDQCLIEGDTGSVG